MPLHSYHLPAEEGEVWEPVQPIQDPRVRFVACSARDADILAWAADLCNYIGKHEEGMALKGLAMGYTLGADA